VTGAAIGVPPAARAAKVPVVAKAVAAVPQTANQIRATVCLAAVVAVVVPASAVMIPTKIYNTDCEVSREEISFWLSHLLTK